jgi:hypothetical protein
MTWGRLALGNGEKETAFEADWGHTVSIMRNADFQLGLTHWLTRSIAIERLDARLGLERFGGSCI